MQINSSKRFIRYLDGYNAKSELNFLDYSNLITNINNNYLRYNDTTLTNMSQPLFVFPQFNSILPPPNPGFFFHNVNFPYVAPNIFTDSSASLLFLDNMVKEPTPKKNIHIDAKVDTLSDLIAIIENHEYDSTAEYNIDLKALHNIKDNLVQINSMIGMQKIKTDILNQLIYFIQDLHRGNSGGDFKHTVIYGPPGTGKTEIAKMIGEMYSKLGILKKNVFKKVTRNDLIAGYLGQTAIKTRKVIDECMGGVLFIDEAYSLACEDHNDSFAKECIDILCEALSDHKDDLMVIVAGYKEEMDATFFRVNKGLKSRFIWQFETDKYEADDLSRIFTKKITDQGWNVDHINVNLSKWIETKKKDFIYYGRDMETLLTYVKISHGRRVYGQPPESRKCISMQDLNAGYECFARNRDNKEKTPVLFSLYV